MTELKKRAFQGLRIDMLSPETKAVTGFDASWGPVTQGLVEEHWMLVGGEELPPGVGYLLLDIAVTFGAVTAQSWKQQTEELSPEERIHKLEALLRRKYKNHPQWGVHKYRFMNRVTRASARARKMVKELSVDA